MTHVLSNVKAGDGEDNSVLGCLQQVNEDSEQFVVLLIEALGILAPELGRLVDGRPFEATAAHLCGVLVEGAEVLHRILQLLAEVLHIGGDVLVVEATLLEDGELLQHLALDHGDAMVLGHRGILRLLDQIAEDREDDARHLLLGTIAEDIGQDGDDAELVHLGSQQGIEGQHPQAEDQLVLHL